MTAPMFQPGDEIEWLDTDQDPPRWRPGRILSLNYEITSDVPGEWSFCRPDAIRSAPRLPLEGIEP